MLSVGTQTATIAYLIIVSVFFLIAASAFLFFSRRRNHSGSLRWFALHYLFMALLWPATMLGDQSVGMWFDLLPLLVLALAYGSLVKASCLRANAPTPYALLCAVALLLVLALLLMPGSATLSVRLNVIALGAVVLVSYSSWMFQRLAERFDSLADRIVQCVLVLHVALLLSRATGSLLTGRNVVPWSTLLMLGAFFHLAMAVSILYVEAIGGLRPKRAKERGGDGRALLTRWINVLLVPVIALLLITVTQASDPIATRGAGLIWHDVLGSSVIVLFSMVWVLALHRIRMPLKTYWFFLAGAWAVSIGETQGLINGFFIYDYGWAPATANALVSLGICTTGVGLVLINQRVSRRQRELEILAQRDALTGLLNRRALNRNIARLDERRRSEECDSVLVLDLDHFKNVNDSYGHAVGDEILKAVAGCLESVSREGDLVARPGGEEFMILLPGVATVHARDLAERIRGAVEALEFVGAENDLRITVSIGVAEACGARDIYTAIQAADEALYAAKRGGRNRVICADDSLAD